jgi:hypothetical protein
MTTYEPIEFNQADRDLLAELNQYKAEFAGRVQATPPASELARQRNALALVTLATLLRLQQLKTQLEEIQRGTYEKAD